MLRTFVWWRGNDRYHAKVWLQKTAMGRRRKRSEAISPQSHRSRALLNGQNINERIMKAEALRELGEFEESIKILNQIDSPHYAAVVHRIRALCDRAEARVQELKSEEA